MAGDTQSQQGATDDLRYRPARGRSRVPVVLGVVVVITAVLGGAAWFLTRSSSAKFATVAAPVTVASVTTAPSPTAPPVSSGAGASSASRSGSPPVTTSTRPTASTAPSVFPALVVSTGCESTCRVYRRDSPWDDLSKRGDSYHIHGDAVDVVCSSEGQTVYDADSGRSSATWYELEGGWWMSGVYLLLDNASAVPAC